MAEEASTLNPIPQPPLVHSFAAADELKASLAKYIIDAQTDAINKKDRFSVAISGGSLPKMLSGLIGNKDVKWNKWHIFYADERVVPPDHPDSNHFLCTQELFSKVSSNPETELIIHKVVEEGADMSAYDDPDLLEDLAVTYSQKLAEDFGSGNAVAYPVFDLILLGIGPDGHTCSLFPKHPLLDKKKDWVASLDDSPKPPPKRVTLTYPILNRADRIVFVATGEGKVDVLSTILDKPEEGLPASLVKPEYPGRVHWFVDDAASAKVKYAKSPYQKL